MRAICDNVESILVENPEMGISDLRNVCARATTIVLYNPKMTYLDLADELNISNYTAEVLYRLIGIIRARMEDLNVTN
jgi:hypothetical protein